MAYEGLLEQANRARQLFEARLIARPLLGDLYVAYNPNVEIESFLDQAQDLFPRLNCGLTAVYIQHLLGDGEIRNGTYNGQGHTFVMIENTVVDITADQFDGPPVYVGPLVAPWALQGESKS